VDALCFAGCPQYIVCSRSLSRPDDYMYSSRKARKAAQMLCTWAYPIPRGDRHSDAVCVRKAQMEFVLLQSTTEAVSVMSSRMICKNQLMLCLFTCPMLSLSPRNPNTLDKENVGDRTRAIGVSSTDRPRRWLNDTSGKVPLRTIAFRAVLLPLTFRRATHNNHVRKLGTSIRATLRKMRCLCLFGLMSAW
jgi:hypothetical protein